MFYFVRTCEHLRLIPPEAEQRDSEIYLYEIKDADTLEERMIYVKEFLGTSPPGRRIFKPYCEKRKSLCVVMESPVISMQRFGGLFQPFSITVSKSIMIESCEDRKLPEASIDRREPIDVFLLKHVQIVEGSN